MPTETEIKRGKALRDMPDIEFLELWQKYKSFTPNELNSVEPFFVPVAMQKLERLVKG